MPKERHTYTEDDVAKAIEEFHQRASVKSKALKPILSPEEEDLLEKWIYHCSERRFPKRKNDLFLSIKELLIDTNRQSKFKAFYVGIQNISSKTTEAVSSEIDIRKWFGSVEDILKEDDVLYHRSRIFNGDESGFLLNPGSSSKALAKKGSKNVYQLDSGHPSTKLTVMIR